MGLSFFRFFWNFLNLFAKVSVVLINYSPDFHRMVINGESTFTTVCLHNPLVSFHFTSLFAAFENVCGLKYFFLFFSKTALPNLKFWVEWIEQGEMQEAPLSVLDCSIFLWTFGSMERAGCGKLSFFKIGYFFQEFNYKNSFSTKADKESFKAR